MQPVRQAHDRLVAHRLARRGGSGGVGCTADDADQRIADRDQPLVRRIGQRHRGTLDDDHRRDRGRGAEHHGVEIEADQRIAAAHRIARRDQRREALAGHRDGVDADMHQQRDALAQPQRHGMAGGMDGQYGRVAGGVQRVADGVDAQPRPHHALGKHRIGNPTERQHPSCQRRLQLHVDHPVIPSAVAVRYRSLTGRSYRLNTNRKVNL